MMTWDKTLSKHSFSNNIGKVGGGRQEKTNFIPILSEFIEIIESLKIEREDMGDLVYDVKQILGQNPNVIDPKNYNTREGLFNAVIYHAIRRQRLSSSTIDHRLRCIRRIQKHSVFPVDVFNIQYNQFIAYMDYREDIEKKGYFALQNDLQAIQMFLVAYGVKLSDWHYRLPSQPKHKGRIIPSPIQVHDIITYDFSDDSYTNNLYQTLHAHNFWIGWRVPSEPCALTIDDVDFDNGFIKITETKKHHNTRNFSPDKAMLIGKTRKSFKNYYDYQRTKVECSKSGNAFYLTSTGLPFTPRHLGHILSETGKLIFPEFQPYVSRHWFAIADLIRTKIETGTFEPHTVMTHLGHDKITTTYTYLDDAEVYYRKYPFDWFKRTLKFDKIFEGDSALKSKQSLKTSVSCGKSGEGDNGLSGVLNVSLGEFPIETFRKNGCFVWKIYGFLFYSLKPFFFSFFFYFNQKIFLIIIFKARISNKARCRRLTHQGVVKYAYFTSSLAHEIRYYSPSRGESKFLSIDEEVMK